MLTTLRLCGTDALLLRCVRDVHVALEGTTRKVSDHGHGHTCDTKTPLPLCGCIPDVASKGLAYVTFREKEGLLKALSMSQEQMGGRSLRVEVARPQQNRGGNRRGESRRTNVILYLTAAACLCTSVSIVCFKLKRCEPCKIAHFFLFKEWNCMGHFQAARFLCRVLTFDSNMFRSSCGWCDVTGQVTVMEVADLAVEDTAAGEGDTLVVLLYLVVLTSSALRTERRSRLLCHNANRDSFHGGYTKRPGFFPIAHVGGERLAVARC